MMISGSDHTAIVGTYFLSFGEKYCRGGTILLSLLARSLFLFVIIIDLLPSMIVKVMHPWAKKALHDLGASVCFMLTCLETHITCVMLLTLLRFILCCILAVLQKPVS